MKKTKKTTLTAWLYGTGLDTLEAILKEIDIAPETFFNAAERIQSLSRAQYRRKNLDEEALEKIGLITKLRLDELRTISKVRRKKKASRIERHYDVIVQLRTDGASWSEIARYLESHHRLKASTAYIYSVMKELGYTDDK